MKDYRDIGLETYGEKCEICGYGNENLVEVHHINYHEHQAMEDDLRMLVKQHTEISEYLDKAKEKGFMEWDGHDLSKSILSKDLSVLCSNCHTLVHKWDVGMNILKALPKRR